MTIKVKTCIKDKNYNMTNSDHSLKSKVAF